MFKTHRGLKLSAAMLAVVALISVGIGVGVTRASAATYRPQTRAFTVTAVPLLVQEMAGTLPYLQQDFAKGGLLDAKEVYGFYPSTLTVYQGDTLDLTLVNPANDPHTFTISALNVDVAMPSQSSVTAHFTVTQPGIYTFLCAEPGHIPYMWGQLIVLPDSAAAAS